MKPLEFIDRNRSYKEFVEYFLSHNPPNLYSRKMPHYELLNVRYIIPKEQKNLLFMTNGKWENLIFPFIEGLWMFDGSENPDMITHYATTLKQFMNDDTNHFDGAYGLSLGKFFDKKSQWSKAIDVLQKDKNSRRAVMNIYDNNMFTNLIDSKDVPCNQNIQLLIRDNRLHMVLTSRSSDIWKGFIYDTIQFRWYQSILSNILDVDIGHFVYNIGSLHCYNSDYEKLKTIPGRDDILFEHNMRHVPIGSATMRQELETLINLEHNIRTNHSNSYLDFSCPNFKEILSAIISYNCMFKKEYHSALVASANSYTELALSTKLRIKHLMQQDKQANWQKIKLRSQYKLFDEFVRDKQGAMKHRLL